MRPFQLLSAIAVFNSLKTVAGEAYWNCNGTPILYVIVRDAVELAFTLQPGSISGYPSIYRLPPPLPGLGQLRQFPVIASGATWLGGDIIYYLLANAEMTFCDVFSTEGLGYRCDLVAS